MIDHITIGVKDLKNSKRFYDKVLAVLGMSIVLGGLENNFLGYGTKDNLLFEIYQSDRQHPAHKNVHVAFKAKDKQTVNKFYKIALAAGAKDNGKPGPRPNYSPTYYACFVLDLDGNNIEACLY